MATIQGVYLALFGRPADPAGLAYFNGITGNGRNLSGIADLSSQPEYLTRFTGKSNSEIVQSIYQSLFGRVGEAEGVNFFVGKLASKELTINTIAINILDGAAGSDLTLVNKKLAAADLFTNAIDTPAEVAAYAGTAAAEKGVAFLSSVAETSSIVTASDADTAVAGLSVGLDSTTQTITLSTTPTSPFTIVDTIKNVVVNFENDLKLSSDQIGFNGSFETFTAAGNGSFAKALFGGRIDVYSSKLKVFDASKLNGSADVDFISSVGVTVTGSRFADSIDFFSPDQQLFASSNSPENGDNKLVYNPANISINSSRDFYSDFFHGGAGDKVDVSAFSLSGGKNEVTKLANNPIGGESFAGNAVAVADIVEGSDPATAYQYIVDTNNNGIYDIDADLTFQLSVETVGSYLTHENFIF